MSEATPPASTSIWKSRKTKNALTGLVQAVAVVVAALVGQQFGLDDESATKFVLGAFGLIGYLTGKTIDGIAQEDAAEKKALASRPPTS